ncbi:MAG: hypothetical protein HY898_06985 [Deltaproteobacteria bacterium]|nr:hypothetical protein [Deltaproteobacteria bacterium]
MLVAHLAVLSGGWFVWKMTSAPLHGGYVALIAAHALLTALLFAVHGLRARSARPIPQNRSVTQHGELELACRRAPSEDDLPTARLASRLDAMLGEHARRASEVRRLTRELQDLRECAQEVMTLATATPSTLELQAVVQPNGDGLRFGSCRAGTPAPSGCVALEPRTGRELVAVGAAEMNGREQDDLNEDRERVVLVSTGKIGSRFRVLLHKIGNRVRDTSSLEAWRRKTR